ncbi:hypothetical protein [uncultured Methylobacterium sp.]|uniref:hypothetical protein n=1 Tax=uncultured Methylobacterium sp. TaxID=157278 RepID=UPI0035CA062F
MIARLGLGGLLLLSLGCTGAHAQEGSIFSNLFRYGGTTVPPSQPKELEAAYCPPIDVPEGGASLQTAGGGGIRTQITLGRLARECTRREDGAITVKVGVEARVLLGPAGTPGRFDVPLTITIKQDAKTIATRSKRVAVTVAPGEAQGFATIVEEDITVPVAMTADYEIAVGLGGGVKAAKPKPRRKGPGKGPVAAAPAVGEPSAAQ